MALHQQKLLAATHKPSPVSVPVEQIASIGHPLTSYADQEKVQRMRRTIRCGGELPPVRLTKLTPELRDKYGIADPSKNFYMDNGHHRLAASKLEGLKDVHAVPFHKGKRI